MREVDRVLDDVDLVLHRRRDVHGGIGDDQRLRVGRDIHDEAVADASRRAQAGVAPDDRAHQLVGVKAALHQRLRLALAHQLDRLVGGRLAVRRVDDRRMPRCRCRAAFATASMRARGPTRIGAIRPSLRRIDRAAQRALVAGMRDGRRRRRQRLAEIDQPLVFLVLAFHPRPCLCARPRRLAAVAFAAGSSLRPCDQRDAAPRGGIDVAASRRCSRASPAARSIGS